MIELVLIGGLAHGQVRHLDSATPPRSAEQLHWPRYWGHDQDWGYIRQWYTYLGIHDGQTYYYGIV